MKNLEITLGERFTNALSSCGVNIDERYVAKVYNNSIELVGVDGEGKRIFGSDITLYNYEDFFSEDKARKFELNTGTMGSFDLSCEASVMKYLAMAELIKNFDLVSHLTTKFNEYYKAETK